MGQKARLVRNLTDADTRVRHTEFFATALVAWAKLTISLRLHHL